MTHYTIQVSDHPEAGRRIPTEAGAASWETVHDGPTSSPRTRANALSNKYRHVRVFKGKNVGKLWYGVFR